MAVEYVEITLRMDPHFVRMLSAHIQLDGGYLQARAQTPGDVIKRVAALEARGATEAQVDEVIYHDWRGHIEAVHEKRRVVLKDD